MQGKRLVFVTNNSTKSRAGYLGKFTGLGLNVNAVSNTSRRGSGSIHSSSAVQKSFGLGCYAYNSSYTKQQQWLRRRSRSSGRSGRKAVVAGVSAVLAAVAVQQQHRGQQRMAAGFAVQTKQQRTQLSMAHWYDRYRTYHSCHAVTA